MASSPTPPSSAATAASTGRPRCSASSTPPTPTAPSCGSRPPRRPPRSSSRPGTRALDCRHGRVLLRQGGDDGNIRFVVWDPITGVRDELRGPGISYATYSVAVLCAVAGCGHSDCRGGPFRVVFAGYDEAEKVVRTCVYSAETRAWGQPASIHLHGGYYFDDNRGVLVGVEIYWTLTLGSRILKYDLSKHCLSWIKPPHVFSTGTILIASGDGSLGFAGVGISIFAGVCSSRLYLWSAVVNPEGIEGWIQWKVIELEKFFSIKEFCCGDRVLGFAEDIGVIFVTTSAGVYTFEPKSGQVTKVSEREDYDYNAVVPFMSFHSRLCQWKIAIASGDTLITTELECSCSCPIYKSIKLKLLNTMPSIGKMPLQMNATTHLMSSLGELPLSEMISTSDFGGVTQSSSTTGPTIACL